MVVFLTLYASSEQEPIISAELARKSRKSPGLEGVILLKQFIKTGEKPYFSVTDRNHGVYQQKGDWRTINLSELGGEVDGILTFLAAYKARKAAEKKS